MGYHFDGGYAEYTKVAARDLLKLPKEIGLKLGNSTLDTVGVPYGSFMEADIDENKLIAVFGCGPIGLSAIKILKMRGVDNIYAVDIVENKLRLAKEFGAKVVINTAKEDPAKKIVDLADGLGADMAFDTSNTAEAFRKAIYSVGKGGNVYAVGEHPSLPPDLGEIFISDILVHRHLGVRGLMYFPIGDHKNVVDYVQKDKESFEKLISHVFPLEKVDEAFKVFFGDNESIRVVIKP